MNRRFKIIYYFLVALFTLVFTYQVYQLVAMFTGRPKTQAMVIDED